MSNKKKITTAILVFGAMLSLGACQKNTWPAPTQEQGNNASPQPETQIQNQEGQMPTPTGEVDDILDTVSGGTQAEEDQMAREEQEALSGLDDEKEADDLSQAYDKNEF